MAHVSHKLRNSLEGALAGGGDPATSPLYVFGPFLKLVVVAGVAPVTFGASIWMVVVTVIMVSAMYRLVMTWVTDGSGGSGLSEEEFGGWAVKINAAITFVEYTLTFLVSMAALVTFIADRYPALNGTLLGFQHRTFAAIALSIVIGWLVNRGPKTAARAFGPATLGVLLLLWAMVAASIWRFGLRVPAFDMRALTPEYLHFTLGGYARILALMTGIEIFANLVAAYAGDARQKSRKAFGSLLIIMGTTSVTMLVVGPAILQLSNPAEAGVSVFTQTMDRLLPSPLPYLGTLVGIVVLGSAAAASAQGLQNLALGLRYRHYIPARIGQRNRFDVADKPVWIQVTLVAVCYLVFGTLEETYLAIYAAGVFILLSMTGWATAKRLARELRRRFSGGGVLSLLGTVVAALLTSGATVMIFVERFFEGAWTYLLFVPILYVGFTLSRSRLGKPLPLEEHLGRFFTGQYLLPYQRQARPEDETAFDNILVPLDGSGPAENSLAVAQIFCSVDRSHLRLVGVAEGSKKDMEVYLKQIAWRLEKAGIQADFTVGSAPAGDVVHDLARGADADLIVMTVKSPSGLGWWGPSEASRVVQRSDAPALLIRPTEHWKSRMTRFHRLLIALDGSEAAEQSLRYARALGKRFQSELLLVSVPETELETARLEQYLASVAEALRGRGLKARTRVGGSGPARTILAVSDEEDADLVVLARRGRGGLTRSVAVGSVAEYVIESTERPVLLIPS